MNTPEHHDGRDKHGLGRGQFFRVMAELSRISAASRGLGDPHEQLELGFDDTVEAAASSMSDVSAEPGARRKSGKKRLRRVPAGTQIRAIQGHVRHMRCADAAWRRRLAALATAPQAPDALHLMSLRVDRAHARRRIRCYHCDSGIVDGEVEEPIPVKSKRKTLAVFLTCDTFGRKKILVSSDSAKCLWCNSYLKGELARMAIAQKIRVSDGQKPEPAEPAIKVFDMQDLAAQIEMLTPATAKPGRASRPPSKSSPSPVKCDRFRSRNRAGAICFASLRRCIRISPKSLTPMSGRRWPSPRPAAHRARRPRCCWANLG